MHNEHVSRDSELKGADEIKEINKLMSDMKCFEALDIIDKMQENPNVNQAIIKQKKKEALIGCIMLLYAQGNQYLQKEEYPKVVELLDDLKDLIIQSSESIGIDNKVLRMFINEIKKENKGEPDEPINLSSFRKKCIKRANEIFGDELESNVLQMFVDCLLMPYVLRQVYNIPEKKSN